MFAGQDTNGDIVVLEDLCQSGYKMVDRLKGLDYDHCKIVLQVTKSIENVYFYNIFNCSLLSYPHTQTTLQTHYIGTWIFTRHFYSYAIFDA